MSEPTSPQLEQSVEIAAEPAQVWALVTDVPRMAQWSPQVVRSKVKGGEVKLGAKFSNVNRRGPLFWPTTGKVVRCEPHRDFAFRIAENKTIWSFELEPTATGTKVTQRRETPDGIAKVSQVMTKVLLGGQAKFTAELGDGMKQTLDRIKAEVESDTAS